MFKRILYENWTTIIPIISFWLTFSVFLFMGCRAFFLKKESVEHLENLPFRDEDEETPNPSKK